MSSATFKQSPYWWEAAPLVDPSPQELPKKVDVLIVGAGYTGLSAAITLARAGREVLALDRMLPGEGASSRNGGITSGNIRPSTNQLIQRFGAERAKLIEAEGQAAREDLYRFIAEENIDCDFKLTGRFSGVMSASEYEASARYADGLAKSLGVEAFAVSRSEVHRYIGTDLYVGGNVRMDVGGLHPGKLHAGMLRVALTSGAQVSGRTTVLKIIPAAEGFVVGTSNGTVLTQYVLVCTNGYTDPLDRWLRRRIVPVRSRIIATEEIAPSVMARLMPAGMMYSDSRQLSYYYRPTPDGRRILFGGRDGTIDGDPVWPTNHLRSELARVFPELDGIGLSHSWFGNVAMNRDMVPRLFTRGGLVYATGFCGSGVVWARWLGKKAASQILGLPNETDTAFRFRPPAAVPFFAGKAWFMPLVYAKLKLSDKLSELRR